VRIFSLLLLAGVWSTPLAAGTVTLTFEGFPDSTILTSQYSGMAFGDAIILTAGITLNEFEFPPHSGSNVASDNNGPMTISFTSPTQSFSGYFTYAELLTMRAFNSANNQVAVATSRFSSNEAVSGNTSSTPNELLQVTSANGISRVNITGAPAGSSFTLDDATITPITPVTVPALSTPLLMLLGLALAALALRTKALDGLGSRKRLALIVVLAPLGLWLSASPQQFRSRQQASRAAPRIARFSADRTAVLTNTPTLVTLSARIDHPALIAGSVNLIRVDASGLPVVVGQFHDDGKNGDGVAGDHTYTIQVTLNERSAGQVRFQVSGAFHGLVKRLLSNPVTLTIKAAQ
jgi:hypothetical protein